jgi:hypothetical protein
MTADHSFPAFSGPDRYPVDRSGHEVPYLPGPPATPPPVRPAQAVSFETTPLMRPASGIANASLTLTLLGLVAGVVTLGLLSLFALITGHMAAKETRIGQRGGHGATVAGLLLGYLGLLPGVLLSLLVGSALLKSGTAVHLP